MVQWASGKVKSQKRGRSNDVSCGTFISEVTDVIVPSERKTALEEVRSRDVKNLLLNDELLPIPYPLSPIPY
ncbi:MAG: hypothetical protein ACRC11_00710 [Xenococcaceae cyanobacterium]